MKKTFFLLFVPLVFLSYAKSDYYEHLKRFDDILSKVEQYYNIDKTLFHAIIKHESGYSRYAVAFRVKDDGSADRLQKILEANGIKNRKKKNGYVVAVPSGYKKAKWLWKHLMERTVREKGFLGILDFDAGIMQINRGNFITYKLGGDYYYDSKKNIIAGAFILNKCYDWAEENGYDDKYAIECYNKGKSLRNIKRGKFRYFKSVANIYKKVKAAYDGYEF